MWSQIAQVSLRGLIVGINMKIRDKISPVKKILIEKEWGALPSISEMEVMDIFVNNLLI